MFFEKKIKKKKLNLNLFGNITIEYDKDYEELTDKLISCLLLLEKGYERFSDNQRKIFPSVNQMTILKENEPKNMQGSASQQTKTIHFNPEWLLKHKTGGVLWLICHESYHVWDPFLRAHTHQRTEGNANLFANKIKTVLEKEPSIYKWSIGK